MGLGAAIAKAVPAPDKLKGYKPAGDEPDADDLDEEGENEAAGVSMMQEVLDAVKGSDAAEACRTLDAYLESRGFVRK